MRRRDFLRMTSGAGGATAAVASGPVAAAQTPTATAQGSPTGSSPTGTATGAPTGTVTGGSPTGTTIGGSPPETEATEAAGGGETHTVDMTDQLVFDPEEITIAPGDTVVWENVGTVGHSVTAYEEEIPEDAEYFASGGFDSEQAARDAYPQQGDIAGGESYQHTFETAGEFGYFCIPHEQVGMVGTVVVQEGGAGGGEGGVVEEADPEEMGVPFQAHFVGMATILALVVVFVFTLFVLKYGETPHSGYPEEE